MTTARLALPRTQILSSIPRTAAAWLALRESLPAHERELADQAMAKKLGADEVNELIRDLTSLFEKSVRLLSKTVPYAMIGVQAKYKRNRFKKKGQRQNPLYPILHEMVVAQPEASWGDHYRSLRRDHRTKFTHQSGKKKGQPRWHSPEAMMRCYHRWAKSGPVQVSWLDDYWVGPDLQRALEA
jgi:hypothetical protein